jgi:hypothetical protein
MPAKLSLVFAFSGLVRRLGFVAPPHSVKIARAICDFVGFALDALTPPYGRLPNPRQHQPTNKESNQSVSQRRTEAPKGRKPKQEGARETNRKRKCASQDNSEKSLSPAKTSKPTALISFFAQQRQAQQMRQKSTHPTSAFQRLTFWRYSFIFILRNFSIAKSATSGFGFFSGTALSVAGFSGVFILTFFPLLKKQVNKLM